VTASCIREKEGQLLDVLVELLAAEEPVLSSSPLDLAAAAFAKIADILEDQDSMQPTQLVAQKHGLAICAVLQRKGFKQAVDDAEKDAVAVVVAALMCGTRGHVRLLLCLAFDCQGRLGGLLACNDLGYHSAPERNAVISACGLNGSGAARKHIMQSVSSCAPAHASGAACDLYACSRWSSANQCCAPACR